jgi:SPP1 family predicted phage head-tail adaptor
MRGGKLRDKVRIEARTPSADSRWGDAAGETWGLFALVWASVKPADNGATESVAGSAEGVASKTLFDVVTRYVAGVTSGHRIVYRGQALDIVAVSDPDGTRRELHYVCAAHVQG